MGILRWKDICDEGSFDGIKFPIRSIYTSGGRTTVAHTYPDVPGQEIEDLGRRATSFTVVAVWSPDLVDYWGENIYPEGFRTLLRRLEGGGSAIFRHPIWGETKCAATDWNFPDDATRPDIVEATVTFVEDSLEPFTLEASTALAKVGDARKKAEQIDLFINEEYGSRWGTPFGDLLDAFNAILYAWNSTWYSIESKFLYIRGQIGKLAETFQLETADNYHIMELAKLFQYDLIEAVNGIEKDLPMFYSVTVGKDTDLFTMSRDIYGDETWVDTLASLNAATVYNPAHVKAGTVITYQVKP